VRPGQVLAIMGPSGSGKTTLLTILAARARPTSGQLRLNGAPYDAAAKALIALVPQDDALFPNLTVRRKVSSLAIHLGRRVFRPSRSALAIDPSRPIVLARGWHALKLDLQVRETLDYAAQLRLPPSSGGRASVVARTAASRAALVDSLLGELGIAHVAGSRVGGALKRGVSGGERKRVAIGVELAGAPPIVLLDEVWRIIDYDAHRFVCHNAL
jgi:ABC-type multidrug transport system ATPase subunit